MITICLVIFARQFFCCSDVSSSEIRYDVRAFQTHSALVISSVPIGSLRRQVPVCNNDTSRRRPWAAQWRKSAYETKSAAFVWCLDCLDCLDDLDDLGYLGAPHWLARAELAHGHCPTSHGTPYGMRNAWGHSSYDCPVGTTVTCLLSHQCQSEFRTKCARACYHSPLCWRKISPYGHYLSN